MKSKYNNAKAAMDRALSPRNEDGLIEPMTFFDEPPHVLLYPHFKPDKNGLTRPMYSIDEFAEGKIPLDLEYVKGYQKPGSKPFNGTNFDSIVYENPIYNLSPFDRRALFIGQKAILDRPIPMDISTSINNGQVKPTKFVSPVEEIVICKSPGSLQMKTDKGDYFLANFSIHAQEHRIIHGRNRNEVIRDEFEIRVCCSGIDRKLTIPAKDMDNIVKRIQSVIPMCTVSSEITKGIPLIVNYTRQQLFSLPDRHYIECTGFRNVGGTWVYVHDNAISPDPNTVFNTGLSIISDRSISAEKAYRLAIEFLGLSDKVHLMVPLLLLAHLGPLFNLFEAAGHAPKFILFLNGRSGSLKTSMAVCLYRLFKEQSEVPEANFKDTETALEIKLGEANSHVLLVDDYRPPVTAAAGKQNLEKLESIIRFVGDRISKSRSNAELGKAKEYTPSGCCIVTGEDTGGSHSSLLRCLVLTVSKGDIDGKKLRRYQDNPLLLTTHMSYFLNWCGQNGERIISFIQESFPKERELFGGNLKEPRLVDTAAILMTTAHILIQYAFASGFVSFDYVNNTTLTWRDAISYAANYSENFSKTLNPVFMYIRAYFDLSERGEILIAPNICEYVSGKHIGYADGDSIWLWHRELYAKVKYYWLRFDTIFPLSVEKISEQLADAGLIEISYETRETGIKRLFSKKSSLPTRSRLMVLNSVLAKQYLDRELCDC